jgi:SprT protein
MSKDNSNTNKRSSQLQVLANYLPQEFVENIYALITAHPLDFKIVRPRKTKLGDFRGGSALKRPVITINGDLNKFQFLVTTVHELAHFYAFQKYGHRIKAHGKEWQNIYRNLSKPFLNSGSLPKELESAWIYSLFSVKASSCTDPNLFKVLRKFSEKNTSLVFVDEIPIGALFLLNGKTFRKDGLRRKRYLCTEVKKQKQYLVSPIAEVELIQNKGNE